MIRLQHTQNSHALLSEKQHVQGPLDPHFCGVEDLATNLQKRVLWLSLDSSISLQDK